MAAAQEKSTSPSERLEQLAHDALDVAKKARRQRKSLAGDNFYGNKLATLRADATNEFRSLGTASAGDSSALAELIENVFSPTSDQKIRTSAAQELCYNLRTNWRTLRVPREDDGLFPLSILTQANRGYLVTVGRQMNGSYTAGWYDAAAVMMRRLIEISIIEAFEGKEISSKIKGTNGNYVQLIDLVGHAMAQTAWVLSRNAKKALPTLRDVGHMSAHGRYFTAKKEDLEILRAGCRIVVEEFLHHAGLL